MRATWTASSRSSAQARCTALTGVNTLYGGLLMHPKIAEVDFSRLRVAIGGGAAVLPTTSAKWKALTGKDILEGYGLSETSPILTLNPTTTEGFSATVGLPFPSTDIKLLDADDKEAAIGEPGEVCAKGPQVMQGYWQKPQANADAFTADGYFRTGDIGVFDAKGFLKIVDRKKDMIIVSGFNVFPNEVEAIAAACAGVAECACVGRPDEKTGEAVRLFVAKAAGRDAHRSGPDRALPAATFGLQGAEGGPLPRRIAEVERGQDPAQGSARAAIERDDHGDPAILHGDGARSSSAASSGASDWVAVDQDRIDRFAACTGDRQWIHVDVERARRESPFGGPIAHGYLSLSLVAAMVMELGVIPPDAATGLNYGLDKVRFIAPVKAGARVRTRASLLAAEAQSGGRVLLKLNCTLEIEGEAKPALVAELLCMLIGKRDAAA